MHDVHCPLSIPSAYLPASQGMQELWLVIALNGLYIPFPQLVHCLAPVRLDQVPAEQFMHEELGVTFENEPAWHAMQVVEYASDTYPTGHSRHAVDWVTLLLNVPLGHPVQLELPK